MFGSSSMAVHLARGAIGAGAIVLAVLWSGGPWWLVAIAFAIALIAFGGCPMCWVVGAFDTWTRRSSARGSSCALGRRPAAPGSVPENRR